VAYESVIRWLGEQGATSIEQLARRGRGRHPRLRFYWRGEEWVIVVSGSPSVEWKAARNAITELRHLMGLVGGEKRVGDRRIARRRQRLEPAALNDPMAQLQRQFAPRGALATLRDVWPAAWIHEEGQA
jgi:hypothetical protein